VWRRPEPPLDRETVDGIIRMLMEMPRLELVVEHLGLGDDDEEEEDDS
jgi:hypothetical protein